MRLSNLAVSPCSNPEMGLDEVLAAYSSLGYRKFEVFTGWVRSAFDYRKAPEFYLAKARQYGMTFSSVHLPAVGDDLGPSFTEAVRAARFAAAIGAPIVLFKATSRENYVRAGRSFLDSIEGLGLTPVLQNHAGQPISTLEDFREVLDGIGDPRMKALLEVGHFHTVGVSWRRACEQLDGLIALVHIKDQIGSRSVPFGKGEIDLPGLFRHMRMTGYRGDYVVEMEVEDRQNTLAYLAQARSYIEAHCLRD